MEKYFINTSFGMTTTHLKFLSLKEEGEFNLIGRTGKNSHGNKITRVDFLNSLNKGDFTESFTIIRII